MAGNELASELLILSEWTARQAASGGRSPVAGDRSGHALHVERRPLLQRIGDGLVAAGEYLRGRAGEPRRARA